MTSSIINYFVDNYLSQFLEINSEETQADLWNGTVELNNIKFKKSIFETLNLPYLELVDGYIGKIKATLSLPRFYLYPIKVEIENVFLHARQKNVNTLSKNEQIKLMEENKKDKLKNDEEFTIQVNQLLNESPGYLQQIINNIQIIFQNIFLIFEDEVSYIKPFNIGISLKKVSYFSTRDDFNDQNIDYNLEESDIQYKRIRVNGFSIFLDYFESKKDLNYQNKISKDELKKIDNDLKQYLKESLNLYAYCMSELNIYSKNYESHFYILYNLILDIKLSMNEKYEKNLSPRYYIDIRLQNFSFSIQITQINALMGEKNYLELKDYYQKGLEKEFYTKNLTEKEIAEYIDTYLNYYKTKYIGNYKDEEKNKKFEKALDKLEDKVSYENIKNMRELCKIKIEYLNSVSKIEEKIQDAENSWYFFSSREDDINKLKEERKKLLKEEKERASKESFLNQIVEIQKSNEKISSKDFLIFHFKYSIVKSLVTIYEEKNKPLIKFATDNFSFETKIKTKSQWISLILGDISIYQYCSKNIKFKKILFSESKGGKNILSIIFENNPTFEKSNFKLDILNEKQLYIIGNMFYVNYIQTILLKPFESIDINKLASNASEEVTKYIKEGYSNIILLGSDTHTNVNLNFNFKTPILILPVNFLEENNNDILYFSIGDILINSELPPRMDPNKDYINMKDKNLLFDNYNITLSNIVMGTQHSYDFKSKPNGNEIITKTNFNIKYRMIIENKNKNFDDTLIDIDLDNITFQINEEQIFLLILFLENMTKEQNIISVIQKKMKDEDNNNKLTYRSLSRDEIKIIGEMKKDIPKKESEEKRKENEKNEKEEKKEDISYSMNVSLKFGLFKINIFKSLTINEENIIGNIKDNDFEKNKTFISLIFKNFNTNVLILNDKMESTIQLGYIYLYDNDYEILDNGNKQSYLNSEFNCIFGTTISTDIKENKFKISEKLQTSITDKDKINEHTINISYISNYKNNSSNMKIIIDECFFSPNLSSITRMYQYFMYYLNIYNESQNILKGQELKEQLGELTIEEIIPKGLFKDVKDRKLSRRQLTRELELQDNKPIIDNNKTNSKIEKFEFKSEIIFEMKHVDIIFPIEPNKSNTQVFFFKYHINMIMLTNSKFENIYQNYQLVQTNYSINESELSFSITNGSTDIYNYKDNYIEMSKFEGLNFDNILNDYSITIKLKSSIDHTKQICLTRIDILTTPFQFIVNFFHVSSSLKFISVMNIYLSKYNEEYSSITTQNILRKSITEDGQISIELNKQKVNKILSNLDNYSLCQEINGSISDIKFDICDYKSGQYKSLINLNLSNMSLVYLYNNDPKDSTNFSYSLIEMISGKKYPIEKYDPKNLFQFIKVGISLKMEYFNSLINQWESFIEPYTLNFNLIQIIKRMRQRIEITSNNMFNINISCNILKAIKTLINKYNKIYNINDDDNNIHITKTITGIHGKNILKIINDTGILLNVNFDNNENAQIIPIENEKSFTEKDLKNYNVNYKNDNSFDTTLSFCLEKNKSINFFNFNHNQIKNYSIDYNGKKLYISVSSYINDELCKCILFSSTITIHNYLIHDEVTLTNSEHDLITIKSDESALIPLKWFILKDKKIYIQYEDNLGILLKDINKPKEVQENLLFKNDSSISIDLQVLKVKDNEKDTIELIHIILNPTITINNKTPFQMKWESNIIEPTFKTSLYCEIHKKESLIEILKKTNLKVKYDDLHLSCSKLIKNDNENKYSILFTNLEKDIFIRVEFEENPPLKYFNSKLLKLTNFKLNSINIIFFFDYIFVNRTSESISIKNEASSLFDRNLEGTISKIGSKKIVPINSLQLKPNVNIKINNSDWSEKFQLDTIGVDFVLKLKDKSIDKFFPIGILIKSSYIYEKTTIIIFENRYTFINNLGIDLLYKEFKDDKENNLQNNKEEIITLKNENNLLFKIGIGKEYSQFFDIENPGRYDLSIKIDPNQITDENLKKTIFTLNETHYIPIRCVIQTYNKGIIYILFTPLIYPISNIKNNSNNKIEIVYNDDNIIIIPENTEIPFIVPESILIDKISFNINKNYYDFSFNEFETKTIKAKNGKYKIKSTPTNSNLTKSIIIDFIDSSDVLFKAREKVVNTFLKYSGYKFSMKLKGLGISIINQDPKEILYISFYGIIFRKKNISKISINKNSEIFDNIVFKCKNIQIDYCLDNSFKVILAPIQQILPSTEKQLIESNYNESLIPFIQLCIYQESKTYINSEPSISYPSIELIIQPLDLKIDHFILNQILSLINDLMDSYGLSENSDSINLNEENLTSKIDFPKEKLLQENKIINTEAIQFLNISSIYITITFRLDKTYLTFSKLPTILSHLITSFSTTFTSITDTSLKFNEIIISHIFSNISTIYPKLYDHYFHELIFQLYKIIGGIDIIGNPIKLLGSIGTGFFELFNEPRKAFLKGPKYFGKGIKKGVSSLLSNIVGGTSDSFSKITGSLLEVTKIISGNSNIQNNEYERREEEPNGLINGTFLGLKRGFNEIKRGITGIVTSPYEGSVNEGISGFFKGVGKGVLGAALSPLSSVLTVGTNISKGISNSDFLKHKVNFIRFRAPRILSYSLPICEYDKMEHRDDKKIFIRVDGKNLEISIQNHFLQLENSRKIYEKMFINNMEEYIIVSNVMVIVLKDFKNVLSKVYLNGIKECYVVEKEYEYGINFKMYNGRVKVINFNDKRDADDIVKVINKVKKA